MTYKCIHNQSPAYLQNLITLRTPIHNIALRKDNDTSLLVYKTPEKQQYKNRGFSFLAPNIWNTLPCDIRNSPTINTFKISLKTHFFKLWEKEGV